MDFKNLQLDRRDSVLMITINRPTKMNALSREVIDELDAVFDDVYELEEIRGVIITGAGEKAFVAGADIGEFAAFTPEQAKAMSANGHRVFNKIESAPKPVIAAVNGFALGGGCELAMACHMRVASDNAKFGQPEVNLGLIPGYGGTQRLIRAVGRAKGIELLLTADMITANEALQYDLVSYVTTKEDLLAKCNSILGKIISKSPLVVDQIIACANSYHSKQEDGFELEIDEFSKCIATEDFKEGTAAFLEKRLAVFKGK
ncbi:MAG: enoyl-CoA hydratase/isomerase family protein [Chitinophagaceae bacterium]|nr:enoyl-CoA hydratase/isomerase family protein [Chitinophagaceae bacterium]